MASPRWPPATEDELASAINSGLLVESHFLDLKRELPAASRNTSVAIDLAAFSVDGGLIFVGVDEDTRPPSITPVALLGLAERIEQIGLSAVDPPVRVRTQAIEISPGAGVLVVIVPPSPAAPHMVDGRYRGRGDKTNYVMNDAEVTRVGDERERHKEDVEALLADYADTALRTGASGPVLLVLAHPVGAGDDLLLRCLGDNPFDWINRVLLRGPLSRPLTESWGPDFQDGLPVEPRANGWSITRLDKATLDLELLENGVLRMRVGDLDYPLASDEPTVNDVAVNGLVKRVVLAAGAIGETCPHYGSWDFALSLTPLRNRHAESARRRLARPMPPYSEEAYVQSTTATYEEITAAPNAVVDRLLGRLNRSFGGAGAIIP